MTGMQIAVQRCETGDHAVRAEGRGPAMAVVREVFGELEVLVEAERDGVFHAEEGVGWVARIPAEGGTFLGQEIDAVVEHGWPGIPPDGTLADSAFLARLFDSLGTVLASAEEGFRRFVDDVEVISDVSDPVLVFPASTGNEHEWYLQVSRSNWPDFRWRIQFDGGQAVDIRAGI